MQVRTGHLRIDAREHEEEEKKREIGRDGETIHMCS